MGLIDNSRAEFNGYLAGRDVRTAAAVAERTYIEDEKAIMEYEGREKEEIDRGPSYLTANEVLDIRRQVQSERGEIENTIGELPRIYTAPEEER